MKANAKRAGRDAAVAEVCFYGTSEVGAGWLARTLDGRMLGTGEPKLGRSFTDALYLACDALCDAGVTGSAYVYEPTGQRRAVARITRPGCYSDLQWEVAPQLVLDVRQIEEAAKNGGAR